MRILKALLFVCLFFAVGTVSQAQTLKDITGDETKPIFYFGIDFTKAVLIGDSNAKTEDIKSRQFDGINDLIVNESSKYDIAGALRRTKVDSDLSFMSKRNATTNMSSFLSTSTADFNHLTEKDVAAAVKALATGKNTGVGFIFVVDAMSKPEKAIAVWATLFDIKTKKVIHTERIEGDAGGFSFRNYWAGGIKKVIEKIDKKLYKQWKAAN